MATDLYTNLFEERRSRRSDNPLVATRLQLAQVMQDFSLKGCLIATEDGRLFASPDQMSAEDAHMLAAIAPEALTERGTAAINRTLRALECASLTRHDLHIQEFWAWDQPLLMLSVGRVSGDHALRQQRAIMGIRRIARQTTRLAA